MIDSFKDEYRFLSNFFPAQVTYEGLLYPSTEHAYQAAKTLDLNMREEIRKAPTAGKAKRLGKDVKIRADWLEVRVGIMTDLLKQKFEHPELNEKLQATGNQDLVEGNTWGDVFWGVCKGSGENMLGKLLMQIRFNNSLK